MTACEYGQMAVWLHGCMIVEMCECMYGKCVPALKLGSVADGVWMCMRMGMVPNERIEVNSTNANTTTTITDQN